MISDLTIKTNLFIYLKNMEGNARESEDQIQINIYQKTINVEFFFLIVKSIW